MEIKFPDGFLWGTATSAYQIEGGIENSDWSKVYPAGRSCDHYSLYEKDFDLMKKLNFNTYRFSIEWSRIEPQEGKFDEKEIAHYRKVLEGLKSREIKAMVTLHHFTLPFWLAKIGGFSNTKSVSYFLRFAQKVFSEYKNLVDFWITLNEPLVYASKGYLEGIWPPQKKNIYLFFKVFRNQVKVHRKIYKLFQKEGYKGKLGIAHNFIFFEPFYRKSLLDTLSAFMARFFVNEYFLNKIKKYMDFIGLNYYFHNRVKFPWIMKNENKTVSDVNWEIYPEGIYHVLRELKKYNLPIYVTENGLADRKDILRKGFIKEHLSWMHKAISEGIDVKGYFHWSLMDNFEWEKGFEPRFGLAEIDYKTLERKPRESAFYFAEIAQKNSLL